MDGINASFYGSSQGGGSFVDLNGAKNRSPTQADRLTNGALTFGSGGPLFESNQSDKAFHGKVEYRDRVVRRDGFATSAEAHSWAYDLAYGKCVEPTGPDVHVHFRVSANVRLTSTSFDRCGTIPEIDAALRDRFEATGRGFENIIVSPATKNALDAICNRGISWTLYVHGYLCETRLGYLYDQNTHHDLPILVSYEVEDGIAVLVGDVGVKS